MPSTQSRLDAVIPALAFFADAQPEIGPAVPAIAMPMHMALDAIACGVTDPATSRSAFAKTFHEGALAPFTFPGVVEAASRAHAAGIAPALVGSDELSSTLLFEMLGPEWRMALAPDIRRSEVKQAVIAAKKIWHGQPALATTLSPFDVARDYILRLEPHLSPSHADPLVFKGIFSFAALKEWLFSIEAALGAAGTDLTPIHGENTVSNVMIDPAGRILLVDFDRAVMADPLFDLGGLCLDLCRNDDERMEAVEIYAGSADQAILARVKLYGLVDDFVWGCWGLLAELNPAMRGPEFYKYANNRFVRLCHHIETFDVGTLLRKI